MDGGSKECIQYSGGETSCKNIYLEDKEGYGRITLRWMFGKWALRMALKWFRIMVLGFSGVDSFDFTARDIIQ
jgi:hypothetical protein